MVSNILGVNVGSKDLQLLAGHYGFSLSELFDIPNKGSYIISIKGAESHMSEIFIIR